MTATTASNEGTAIAADDEIIRLPQVKKMTGVGTTFIYVGMADGTFPKSIKLGPRATGWLKSHILAWMAARVNASQPAANADNHAQAA